LCIQNKALYLCIQTLKKNKMKDLKDVKHVSEIQKGTMQEVQHWLKQCGQCSQLTKSYLWERESDLKDEMKNNK